MATSKNCWLKLCSLTAVRDSQVFNQYASVVYLEMDCDNNLRSSDIRDLIEIMVEKLEVT